MPQICLPALAAAVLASFAPPSPPGDPAAPPRFAEVAGVTEFSGRLIVRPRQDLADRAGAEARLKPIALEYFPDTDEFVVAVPPNLARGEGENALAAELMATGDYQYAEPDWLCYPLAVPNDPEFSRQWHHQRMRSAQAWEITTGSPAITVAVADTGIDLTHPDLAPIRVPGFNSASDLREIDGGDVSDINGHGTHVAGCAAAIGNNATGVSGMGWNMRLMAVRVTNSTAGTATLTDILQGARWAADNGAKAVSVSYSGVANSSVETTGAAMRAVGSLLVFAAGNDGLQLLIDQQNVMVVGATDDSDNRPGYSAYGPGVDVFAPGSSILSTVRNGAYGTQTGTSMAAPVVAGLCGLIWSLDPAFTFDQVENFVQWGCVDLGEPGDDATFGFGRADALNSITLAAAAGDPRAPDAGADAADTLLGRAITIDVLANDRDPNGQSISLQSFDTVGTQGGSIRRVTGVLRDKLRYTAPASGTFDTFTYTIVDTTGRSSTGTVTMTLVDPATLRQPDAPAAVVRGINASFYALTSPSAVPDFAPLRPYARATPTTIDFPSSTGEFMTSGRTDNVGALFRAYVRISVESLYTFYTASDDGSKLWIGDTLVVDNDGLHGWQERSGRIGLRAGDHAITVGFIERSGGAGLVVSYERPDSAKRAIPASVWYRACNADFNADGFVDFFDFDDFIACFDAGACPIGQNGDFNADGFADFFDVDDFVAAYVSGC
jgi:subtilisin family serine protease